MLLCRVGLEQGLRRDAGVMLLIASPSPGQGRKLSRTRLGLLLWRLPQAVHALREHRGLLQVFRGPGQHEDPQAQPRVQSWPVWREPGMGILRSDRWVLSQLATHCLSRAWDIQYSGSSRSPPQCPHSVCVMRYLPRREQKPRALCLPPGADCSSPQGLQWPAQGQACAGCQGHRDESDFPPPHPLQKNSQLRVGAGERPFLCRVSA